MKYCVRSGLAQTERIGPYGADRPTEHNIAYSDSPPLQHIAGYNTTLNARFSCNDRGAYDHAGYVEYARDGPAT